MENTIGYKIIKDNDPSLVYNYGFSWHSSRVVNLRFRSKWHTLKESVKKTFIEAVYGLKGSVQHCVRSDIDVLTKDAVNVSKLSFI